MKGGSEVKGKKRDKQTLVRRALEKNDRQAFDDLLTLCHPSLYQIVLKITYNLADTEAILSEALEKAFGSLSKYSREQPFCTWFFSFVINHSIDYLRKQDAGQNNRNNKNNRKIMLKKNKGLQRKLWGKKVL